MVLLSLSLTIFAQKPVIQANAYDKQAPAASELQKSLKGDGDVFWSTTFNFADPSNPLGWSWPEGWVSHDNTEFGNVWIWSKDSILGYYTKLPGVNSYSPEDGWLILPSDAYNYRDNVQTLNNVDAYIQLAPIDCSSKSSVVVRFYQQFRTCCDNAYVLNMMISNDDGVHWANYDCRFGTRVNDWALKNDVEINITDVAAGMGKILIRFYYASARNYFWAIDDLRLTEAYHNDLVLEGTWAYMTNGDPEDEEGFVPYIPYKFVQGTDFGKHTFKAAFLNQGTDDQEGVALQVNVNKAGTQVYTATSEKSDIWTIERDTIDLTGTPFQPDGFGDYHLVYNAISENQEQVPANNSRTYYLTVSDSIYSRCDDINEDNQSTAGWSAGGNSDGDMLGVLYKITKPVEVNSLTTLITQRLDRPGAGTRVGFECQYWIYKNTEEGWIPLLSSGVHQIAASDLDEWLTMSLDKDGEAEFLEPGEYIAAIQTYHFGGLHANNGQFRFSIGYDKTYNTPSGKTLQCWIESGEWIECGGKLNMIRMNIKETGGPATGTVVFNVDMNKQILKGSMNPATDFVDVAGTFNNWGGSAHMTDTDGDGIYTISIDNVPVFKEIEYKYRINGSWTLAEFPNGAPNREAMVRYYTVLNDNYNNNISVLGVPVTGLTSSVSLYPNPASNMVTIAIANAEMKDVTITLTNLQGQTVMRKEIRSVMNHNENLDLSGFAKGIYLVRVNDTVSKLIVQ
jgi:hypothetical protein